MTTPVRLAFLGCGDAFGSGGRLHSCFLVQAASTQFLVDCGASSLIALHRQGMTTDEIQTIFITHFHGDHYGGLPFVLLEAAKVRQRTAPLTIVTPTGGRARVRELMEALYPGTSTVMDELDLRFIEYDTHETINVHGVQATAFPMIHAAESLPHGLRITVDGKVIGFSGDTSWTDALQGLAEKADLLVCECNHYHTPTAAHLDYQTLQQYLPTLGATRIILNHLGDEMLDNLDRVALECATDGMVVEI